MRTIKVCFTVLILLIAVVFAYAKAKTYTGMFAFYSVGTIGTPTEDCIPIWVDKICNMEGEGCVLEAPDGSIQLYGYVTVIENTDRWHCEFPLREWQ